MKDEEVQPIDEQAATTAENYHDPYGPDPDDIPDPMPDELTRDAGPGSDTGMEGDSPTG